MTLGDPSPAEERLRHEVAGLAVDEILALCYAFQHKVERLCLYLDVLRKRGGERAQFACCLICFDLARQGGESFQQEFAYLADTMRHLAQNEALVSNLVGGDPYLSFLWELCEAQLEEMDTRFGAAPTPTEVSDVASVDLLSDDDFEDFGIAIDDSALWMQFDDAVEEFLGGEPGQPIYDPEAGFRLRSSHDGDRIEHFVRELDSLRDVVPAARGYRAIVLLFLGSQMRSRTLFGGINKRKQALLREGLREFVASGPEIWKIAGVMNPLHMAPDVWTKITDVLVDYVRWFGEAPTAGGHAPDAYDPVARLK